MTRAASHLQALPRAHALRFGSRLGALGYRLASRARRRTLANLRLAFGDTMTDQERGDLARRVFAHFGRAIVDFLCAPSWKTADLEQMVTCDGWEHAQTALDAGHGLLLVTAHIGNWELMGRWLAQVKHVPLTVVARDPRGAAFAAYIKQTRENAGFRVLSAGTSARELLRVLRRGEAILLLADQNSGDVFAPFFGIPAGTVAGPASLALHTNAPIVPIFFVQNPDGTYQVHCSPPVCVAPDSDSVAFASKGAVPENTTRTHTTTVATITARINAVLEAEVRRYPEQWLWPHNRWKSVFDTGNKTQAWGTGDAADAAYNAARARWRP